VPSLRLFILTIFFPLLSMAMLWRRPRRPVGGWLATLLLAAAVTSFSVLAAPWGWFGIPLRVGLIVLFVAALVRSLSRPPLHEATDESPLRILVKVLIAVFVGSVVIGVLRAHVAPPRAIDLAFPLRGGSFLVMHGGSTSAANMHNIDPAQRYAVDVVQLNAVWMRARGLYPRELERYAIFGAEVLSPCDGAVIAAEGALEDLEPGKLDEKNRAGNHVVIRCGDADVTLAQLARGSVTVRPGMRVTQEQLVGRVGNSGLTTEPHLHVHAERGGAAVPMTFDGVWLVRNDIVRR